MSPSGPTASQDDQSIEKTTSSRRFAEPNSAQGVPNVAKKGSAGATLKIPRKTPTKDPMKSA
jgi:hypothetical protein